MLPGETEVELSPRGAHGLPLTGTGQPNRVLAASAWLAVARVTARLMASLPADLNMKGPRVANYRIAVAQGNAMHGVGLG